MKKKLYFVTTNAYDMLVSDDGETRRVLIDNSWANLRMQRERVDEFLREVEDDSSWQEFAETVDELTDGAEIRILAEIETDI